MSHPAWALQPQGRQPSRALKPWHACLNALLKCMPVVRVYDFRESERYINTYNRIMFILHMITASQRIMIILFQSVFWACSYTYIVCTHIHT